ncbi:hypothetical protein J2T60_001582 [Natronospira proteinivora]|uniref:Heme-binding HmuY-like protein n=1 Tax=Natronospira proteinivora TaxID=1807133 RepID=A0ABT1GCB7_9GAMM|nr:HmuY family protein [Natronospira proteinivora]MCP1727582.1 hypothetical protein [Natronospira proteinivora]
MRQTKSQQSLMNKPGNRLALCLTLALSGSLAGCFSSSDSDSPGNGSDNGDNDTEYQAITLDATDSDQWTHLNLDNGEVVSAEQDWHIAARRTDLKLNGGASGEADVVGALIQAQEDYYDDEGNPDPNIFLNRQADDELDTLLAEFDEPDDQDWYREHITNAFDDDWYLYDPASGNMEANSNLGWLVRGHDGESYAALVVEDFLFRTRAGEGVEAIEFDLRVQPAGASGFEQTFSLREDDGIIPASGGVVCFHFADNGGSSDCSSDDWDVQLGFEGRDVFLRSNSGPSGPGQGGLFGPMDRDDLDEYQEATYTPGGQSIAHHYSADTTGGVFAEHSWYAYNLEGRHQLWPNYRVYLIDSDENQDDAPRYALQVTDYYDDAGESGHVSLRYREAPGEDE